MFAVLYGQGEIETVSTYMNMCSCVEVLSELRCSEYV
jgi:hypothetical protein